MTVVKLIVGLWLIKIWADALLELSEQDGARMKGVTDGNK